MSVAAELFSPAVSSPTFVSSVEPRPLAATSRFTCDGCVVCRCLAAGAGHHAVSEGSAVRGRSARQHTSPSPRTRTDGRPRADRARPSHSGVRALVHGQPAYPLPRPPRTGLRAAAHRADRRTWDDLGSIAARRTAGECDVPPTLARDGAHPRRRTAGGAHRNRTEPGVLARTPGCLVQLDEGGAQAAGGGVPVSTVAVLCWNQGAKEAVPRRGKGPLTCGGAKGDSNP